MPFSRALSRFREVITQATRTAVAHPLRSGLGALAMAVGVATVATVIMALDGLAVFARTTTARAFGADTFVLARIASPGSIGRRELEEKLGRNPLLRRSDLRFLERWAGEDVFYAGSARREGEATMGSRTFENAAITGTSAALADIRDLAVERGRFLSREDETRAGAVVVIGRDLADTLFPGLDPVGRKLRVAGRAFEVIGVQARLGTTAGASQDRYLWMPLTTWERLYGAPEALQVFARSRDTARTTEAEDRTRATMRARRRLQPGVTDTFDILSPTATRGFVASLTERVSAASLPLSAMALLASIVVVTNTTLVSVTQRTREIGVRRALGATRRQIVREVLVESTLIALVGGTAGILVVLGASSAVRAGAAVPLSLGPSTALWSFGSAALAGVLSGLYPAQRASRIDIVAAVRAE
ncbi:MAG: ABC transporter permease [Acidobacteriota bacterium]